MSSFGDMLRFFRKQLNMTQFELADKTGISRSRINNYENGLREPDHDTTELFADFFKVSVDTMLGRTDDGYKQVPDEVCDLLAVVDKLTVEDKAIIKIIADKYK
mgnify:CR=1 FL=1